MRHRLCTTLLSSLVLSIGGVSAASAVASATPSQPATAASPAAPPTGISSASGLDRAGLRVTTDKPELIPAPPGQGPNASTERSFWGWVKAACSWVKKHIGFANGTPVYKGTHNIGGG